MSPASDVPIRIFGAHEERTVEQLRRCLAAEDDARGVLCADGHVGYSQPIGGVVAYREHVSPSGCGYDIACGNKAVRTDLLVDDVRPDVPRLMDEIFARVSFGVGRVNEEPVEHEVIDAIAGADFEPQRRLRELAAKQLGTVGAGNHYVDLFAGDDGRVWVGVHFGSRGFGHRTASGFLALAQGLPFDARAREGEMDSPPVLFPARSELGRSYLAAMELAGRYAYAGRDVVVDRVLEILGARAELEVHNHHNYMWRETHDGVELWVVRKGSTPAFPGQLGFVGATMGGVSVILEGLEGPAAREALHSTVHGAGRVMSRTQAAGRMGTVGACSAPGCRFTVSWKRVRAERPGAAAGGRARLSLCPDHPTARMVKRRGRLKAGAIDFDAVRAQLRSEGIELRGGAADEAPGVYRDLGSVLAAHAGTVRVVHELRPLGVAMAPGDTYDPYKD